ncbi:putative porin [Alcaligenes sp. NLF5-7]|uniref:putative porin n=1 Tax=Alcaligenes sp. NLF5-7 TaxID=2918755 RepID=UPI0020C33611|nr:putative porin [Alcaligenes sp. NLF5-7]UTM01046.1 putative porin [Alcaligenes sp. NLF5-7]
MKSHPTRLACAVALALSCAAGPLLAQPAPSQNATINLIRLLVEQGVLKPEQAEALVAQAEAEAVQARDIGAAGAAQAQPGDVRVTYIPETVRDEIRNEVKADVMAQAQAENWAAPNTFPDWASRITVEGDVRVRNESRLFDGGNSNEIINFNKWNENGPIPTVVGNEPYGLAIPYLNTRQDRRNQWRVRARLGIKAHLSDQWEAGIRLASGSDDNPVSTTDTLGNSMGKKNLWLDQVYLRYRPMDWATITAGRAANPFDSTDLLWSNDLNFDGISAAFNKPLSGRPVTLFGGLGAYALDYSSNPWSNDEWGEGKSENKWLFGAQIGAEWRINPRNSLRGSLAYYHFDNITGQRSSACTVYSASDVCDTDWSRPSFMQKGNTLFLLRDIRQWSADPADWNEWQYVGLASEFNLLDVNLRWDTRIMDGLNLRLAGNYVRNLAYDEDKMIGRAGGLYNIASNGTYTADGVPTGVESGPNAWMVQATVGNGLGLINKGDWMAFAGYKYIEPDAMPDGYNDSSFHLGGTNARGYFIGAGYAFEKNVYGQLRWSSSKEVYGAPLSIDVLQLELNARF